MVILSLGSNIGPEREWIAKAVREISAMPGVCDVRQSPLYETAPEGVPDTFRGQPFLNGIVTLMTHLPPEDFSRGIHAVEDRLGRMRNGTYGAPRTIDIDIIAFGDIRSDAPELTLPHPRAATRRFVLQPLADLLPDYCLPGQEKTVRELLEQS